MSIFQTLRDKIIGRKRRKFTREHLHSFLKVTAIVDEIKYTIKDYTVEGFALDNQARTYFEIGKIYSCHILLKDQPRLTIKFKVVRSDGTTVGCSILDQDIFQRFVEHNLAVANKI